jgi:hypothetical protein
MNIGSLYKVKKYFWLLFPTKETAATATPGATASIIAHAAHTAWYSKFYNCEVTYFSLDSIVVFLEEDGVFKKVLTSDGLVGWTWFSESYNDCFEEVKSE